MSIGNIFPSSIVFTSKIMMKKLECIIKPFKLEAVKEALESVGVQGMTVMEVQGFGRQKGHTEHYRGAEYTMILMPKLKVKIVIPENIMEKAVRAIQSAARTGRIGDGKIFITDADDVIRIRTGERGLEAV